MAFALALPLIGMASAGAAARADGPAAQAQPHCGTVPTQRSRVTKDSSLTGIAVTARCNAWAVGWNFTGPLTQTLIEHWNGAKWTQVPSPSPYRPHGDNLLYGVAATSFRNAWAVGVGAQRPGVSAIRTLTEHWDGTGWMHVSSPTPGGGAGLNAVAVNSPADAWAAGWYQAKNSDVTLIEHWNGKSWTHVPSPNPDTADALLTGIAATSASNSWAVGYSFTPGVTSQSRVTTVIERWNGESWSLVPSPSPAGALDSNELTAVAALSGANAWIIGNHAALHIETEPVAEHWSNGWHLMPTPILR